MLQQSQAFYWFFPYHLPRAAILLRVKYSHSKFIKLKTHFRRLETDFVINFKQGTTDISRIKKYIKFFLKHVCNVHSKYIPISTDSDI